jgi:hypothetical protein
MTGLFVPSPLLPPHHSRFLAPYLKMSTMVVELVGVFLLLELLVEMELQLKSMIVLAISSKLPPRLGVENIVLLLQSLIPIK